VPEPLLALPGVSELATSTEFAECQRMMLAAWTHGVRFGERSAALGGRSDSLFKPNTGHRRNSSSTSSSDLNHTQQQSANPLVSPTAARVQAASPAPLLWVRTALGAAKSKHSRENAASIAHLTPSLAARMTNYHHAPSRASSPSALAMGLSSSSGGGSHLTNMDADRSDLSILFERLPSSLFVFVFMFVAAAQRTQIGLVSRLFARVAQHATLWRHLDLGSSAARLDSRALFAMADGNVLSQTRHISLAGCELSPSELVALASASAATLTSLDLSHAHIASKENRADIEATTAWLHRRGLADENASGKQRSAQVTADAADSAGPSCTKDDQMSTTAEAIPDADMNCASPADPIVIDASSIATLLLVLNCTADADAPCDRPPFSALTKLSLNHCTGLSDDDLCAVFTLCTSLTSLELSNEFGSRATICQLLSALPSFVMECEDGHSGAVARAGSTLHSPFAVLPAALPVSVPGSHRLRVLRLSAIAQLSDAVLIDVMRFACPFLLELCVDQCTQLTDLSLHAVPPTLRTLSICLNSNVTDGGVTSACAIATELTDVNVSFCFRLTDAVLRTAFARLPHLLRLSLAHAELLTSLAPLHALLSGQPPTAEYQPRSLAFSSASGVRESRFTSHHNHASAGGGLVYLNISGCHALSDAALIGVGRAIGTRAGVQVVVLNAGIGIEAVAAARMECPNSQIYHA
jgi:hypothetical protein